MAIDFASKVITYFKADTSDMKSKLRELSDEERRLQQQHIASLESRNASYDGWISSLGKANQALELVARTVAFAADSFQDYSEDLRLRSAAGAVNLEELKKASLGLRTEHELLTFAAKTQNGVFKLTQEQMETAQMAMIALTRAGHDQAQVTDKVTQALIKGKAEGLDDFGLAVKEGKTDIEKFNNLMDALASKATGVSVATMSTGEQMSAMGVSVSDSFASVKKSIGELVAAMAPLIKAIADAVGITAQLLNLPGKVISAFTTPNKSKLDTAFAGQPTNNQELAEQYADQIIRGATPQNMDFWRQVPEFMDQLDKAIARRRTAKVFAPSPFADPNFNPFAGEAPQLGYQSFDFWQDSGKESKPIDEAAFSSTMQRMLKTVSDAQEKAKKSATKTSRSGGADNEKIKQDTERQISQLKEWAQGVVDAKDVALYNLEGWIAETTDSVKAGVSDMAAAIDPSQIGEALNAQLAAIEEHRKQLEEMKRAQTVADRESFLSQTFGKPEEFSLYADAFSMLSGAIGSAMDAWITGSMSAGQAIKKFIADALKANAIQMATESLKHAAYAIGFGALGDPRAGMHVAAALKFAAASAAMAAGAKALGGSGGAGSGASAGGASASSGGGAAAGQRDQRGTTSTQGNNERPRESRPVYVIVGEHFSEESPRARRQKADAAVERALRERDE
jgi:hypothetical protein